MSLCVLSATTNFSEKHRTSKRLNWVARSLGLRKGIYEAKDFTSAVEALGLVAAQLLSQEVMTHSSCGGKGTTPNHTELTKHSLSLLDQVLYYKYPRIEFV